MSNEVIHVKVSCLYVCFFCTAVGHRVAMGFLTLFGCTFSLSQISMYVYPRVMSPTLITHINIQSFDISKVCVCVL